MKKREYQELWYKGKYGVLSRVFVYKTIQPRKQKHGGPLEVYRDTRGMTYRIGSLRTWEQLSRAEKKEVYQCEFETMRDQIALDYAKDSKPTDKHFWRCVNELKTKANSVYEAIDEGKPVPPPQY